MDGIFMWAAWDIQSELSFLVRKFSMFSTPKECLGALLDCDSIFSGNI